jgi:ABC-2 type transport system permease protein
MVAATHRIFLHRDLLTLLLQKELKIKYKGTALGMLWSLLNPLLMMVVYTIVFSTILRFSVPRYPIFLLSGLLPWTAFAGTLTTATVSIVRNGHLVRKIAFPHELLPLSAVLAALANLLPSFAVLLVFAFAFQQPLGLPLLALPLLIAIQFVFSAGLVLLLSAVTVYFRDVEYLVGIGVTVWFFATPVLYPLSFFDGRSFRQVLLLNPMTWLIDSYQRIWHANAWPDGGYLLLATTVALATLALGAITFARLQRRFAEEV